MLATACSVSYDRLNIRPSASQPFPQSNAHSSHKTPTDRRRSVGLGYDQLACRAFQRKMQRAKREEGNSLTTTHTHLSTHFVKINIEHPELSASKAFTPSTGPHLLWTVYHPRVAVMVFLHMLAPHLFLRQRPSQNLHISVTSDQTTPDSSSDSSVRPLATFCAQTSASLLWTRKMCTAHTSSQIDGPAPPFPHLFLDSPHATSCRPLPCIAVDPPPTS